MSTLAAATGRPWPWLRHLWIFAPDAGPEQRFVASALCAVFALAALAAKLLAAPLALWLFAVLSYVCGGLRATTAALVAVRARQPDINFLMIVAAVVSALLGHWGDGASCSSSSRSATPWSATRSNARAAAFTAS